MGLARVLWNVPRCGRTGSYSHSAPALTPSNGFPKLTEKGVLQRGPRRVSEGPCPASRFRWRRALSFEQFGTTTVLLLLVQDLLWLGVGGGRVGFGFLVFFFIFFDHTRSRR